MPFTPPTPDDLAALSHAREDVAAARDALQVVDGRLEIVLDRLSVEQPPPPVSPVLPAGVGIGGSGAFLGLTRANRQKMLALAKACGLTHFRFSVSWSTCEQVKGQYQLAGVLQNAQDIVAAGLIPQALIGWCPPAYRANAAAGANSAPKNDAATRGAWELFLRALLPQLYAIGVRRIEIWNEPNFLFMQPVSPGVWVDLVLTAHAVASDISRHFVIVAGGVCPAVDDAPRSMGASAFYDAVLAYEPDFFRYVDEVGIHPYSGDHTKLLDGQFWRKHVTYLQTIVPADTPLCGTEHGWKSVKNTEAERAVLYVDSVLSVPDKRAPLFLFSMFDFAELYGLVTKDGVPKPVYTALQELLVP